MRSLSELYVKEEEAEAQRVLSRAGNWMQHNFVNIAMLLQSCTKIVYSVTWDKLSKI